MHFTYMILPGIAFVKLVLFWKEKTLFDSLAALKTGVTFSRTFEEREKTNVFTYMNIYTGAGLAAGEGNNDGLTDLFFSGKLQFCRFYNHRAILQYEYATERTGFFINRWCKH